MVPEAVTWFAKRVPGNQCQTIINRLLTEKYHDIMTGFSQIRSAVIAMHQAAAKKK